ncbi:MAG: tRNA 4-thiouridine(8) synthase ThiI, partial [Hydrogeniiclostridium sp.]
MKEVLLLKLGEIVLKGLNRNTFENALIKNIRRRLAPLGEFEVRMAQSTITVTPGEGADFEGAVERVRKIFGVITFSRACVTEKSMEAVCAAAVEYLRPQLSRVRTFKVETKRS